MNETGLWLNYLFAGVVAIVGVWSFRMRIWTATAVATGLSLCIWTIMSALAGGSIDDPLFKIGLFMNGLLATLFAVGCAGITKEILESRQRS